jgi:hypothetical protein
VTPVEYVEEDRGYGTPCWIWQRGIDAAGYGRVAGTRAHRVFYERHVGPIPEGLTIDHLCRVRSCCNPAHLEPVTAVENVSRGHLARRGWITAQTHVPDTAPELADGIRAARAWVTHARLERIYGIGRRTISELRAQGKAAA